MSKSFFESQTEISDEDRLAVNQALEKVSTVTKLLLILSEYLEHGGDDEVGAELIGDFAVEYSDHEEDEHSKKQTNNKLLN